MSPEKPRAGDGPPRTGQGALDWVGPKRLLEQGIIAEVKHPDAQIVAGPPVRVDQLDLPARKVCCHLAPRSVPLCPAGFESLPKFTPGCDAAPASISTTVGPALTPHPPSPARSLPPPNPPPRSAP